MARKRVLSEPASVRTVLSSPVVGASLSQSIRFAYRGFGIAVFANILGETLYFGVLEYIRHILTKSRMEPVRDSIGGFGAELSSLVLTTPMSVVCHRQMTAGFGVARDVEYGSVVKTARIVTSYGHQMHRLFSGFAVAMTALPAGAIWWGIYSQSKHVAYAYLRQSDDILAAAAVAGGAPPSMTSASTRDNPVVNGACGLVASVFTTLAFNPINVVRTRIQSVGGGAAVKVCTDIFRKEGARGFFKGAGVSCCSAALEGTVVSSIYEYTKFLADHTLQ